eukprot:ctg_714.g294
MEARERRLRHEMAYEYVSANPVRVWYGNFIEDLDATRWRDREASSWSGLSETALPSEGKEAGAWGAGADCPGAQSGSASAFPRRSASAFAADAPPASAHAVRRTGTQSEEAPLSAAPRRRAGAVPGHCRDRRTATASGAAGQRAGQRPAPRGAVVQQSRSRHGHPVVRTVRSQTRSDMRVGPVHPVARARQSPRPWRRP